MLDIMLFIIGRKVTIKGIIMQLKGKKMNVFLVFVCIFAASFIII